MNIRLEAHFHNEERKLLQNLHGCGILDLCSDLFNIVENLVEKSFIDKTTPVHIGRNQITDNIKSFQFITEFLFRTSIN